MRDGSFEFSRSFENKLEKVKLLLLTSSGDQTESESAEKQFIFSL